MQFSQMKQLDWSNDSIEVIKKEIYAKKINHYMERCC